MSDTQWTGMLRPLLGGIRSNASWVRHHAKEIEDKVKMLPHRPVFETEAQSELDLALDELAKAQRMLHDAKLDYLSKPDK